MAVAIVLSEADRDLLQTMLDERRSNILTPSIRSHKPELYEGFPASDVYLALPPGNGIPPITHTDISGAPSAGDTPGQAQCQIFRITNGEVRPIPDMRRTVYNLADEAVPYSFVPVIKTKGGVWIVASMGGGALILAKSNIAFTKGTAGSCSLYEWGDIPGDETDTGVDKDVYARFSDVGDNAWMLIKRIADDYYEIVEHECDPAVLGSGSGSGTI